MSTTLPAKATTRPSCRLRSTGFGTTSPVVSSVRWMIVSIGNPRASRLSQPVSCSATGFK